MKKLLIIAWEYPGVASKQGAALARRIGQVSQDFQSNNYHVTVVHKDHVDEVGSTCAYKTSQVNQNFTRIAVSGLGIKEYAWYEKVSVLRRLSTIMIAFFKGDRSYKWANQVIRILPSVLPKHDYKPDLIIAFFTPRAPIAIAKYAGEYYQSPWIADFQDSFDEGYTSSMLPVISYWTQKNVNKAKAIVHVSPEWAQRDQSYIGKPIHCIRHAVPVIQNLPIATSIQGRKNELVFIYAGSLELKSQSISLFIKVFNDLLLKGFNVKLHLAGQNSLYTFFEKEIIQKEAIVFLGWLSSDELSNEIQKADVCLIIPWSLQPRQVIPSKMFEYMAYRKPIFIVGEDTGSFAILMNELGHYSINTGDYVYQYQAVIKAFQADYSAMFQVSQCANSITYENVLCEQYLFLLK